MSAEDGKSLSERVEVPGISKEAAKKIELLEQEFINAEVEQRMYTLLNLYYVPRILVANYETNEKKQCVSPFLSCADRKSVV